VDVNFTDLEAIDFNSMAAIMMSRVEKSLTGAAGKLLDMHLEIIQMGFIFQSVRYPRALVALFL